MKKLSLILLILAVAVAGFAGGQNEGKAGKANIVFYTPAWGNAQLQTVLAKYLPEHPNVQVTAVPGPSVWADHVAKSTLWMNTKYSGVDIEYQDDAFALDGAALGVWEDLWPHMSQAMKDDLTDIQLQYKQLWGGMYRVPWWQGMSYTYYNKKLFQEAGLHADHLAPVAVHRVKITRDLNGDGQVDQFGYVATGEEGAFAHSCWEFLYQAGGEEWKLFADGKADPKASRRSSS